MRFAGTSRSFLFAAVFAVGIAAIVAYQLMHSRTDTWQRASTAHQNLLFTVSHLLERTVRKADLALQHSQRALALNDVNDLQALPDNLLFRGELQDGVGIEIVLDAQGRLVRSSRPVPDGNRDFSERDYFRVHQQGQAQGLYMSRPFLSKIDGQSSIGMSRRWDRPDGRFGGVVVQTLKLNTLLALLTNLELGPGSGINLIMDDGTVVLAFPYSGPPSSALFDDSAHLDRILHGPQASFIASSPVDGSEKLYSWRPVGRYPLIVVSVQGVNDILGEWRRNALWLGVITLIFLAACMMLARMIELELRAHRITTRRLQRSQEQTRTILASLPAMVGYWGDDLINRFSNQAHQQWLGLAPSEIEGRHFQEVFGTRVYELLKPAIRRAVAGDMQRVEWPISGHNGLDGHVMATLVPDVAKGRTTGFFMLTNDITERKAAEDRLLQEKERFRVTLEAIRDAVITTDANGLITYQNPAAAAMTGWSLSEALGRPVDDVVMVEDMQQNRVAATTAIHKALERRRAVRFGGEHVLVSRTGDRHHIEDSAAPILDEASGVTGAVMVFQNVSQARAVAHRMTRLAQHDALTGLPNRRLLYQLVRQAMARADRHAHRMALFYMDLDGFKAVNDTCGHAAGDQLLVEVARRLSATLRLDDTLARVGGDEFVVVMHVVHDPQEAVELAERLLRAAAERFVIAGCDLSVTVSIGISIYPDDAGDRETLMSRADQAMYRAKEGGRNRYCLYADA